MTQFDATRDKYQAILVEDTRVQIDFESSTARSGDPQRNVVEPGGATRLALRCLHRALDEATTHYDIAVKTTRGGLPDGGGDTEPATFAWHLVVPGDDEENLGEWVGWDPPYLPASFEPIGTETAIPSVEYGSPGLCVSAANTLLISFLGVVGSVGSIFVRRRLADASAFGDAVIIASSPIADTYGGARPRLLALPDGRVNLYHLWRGEDEVEVTYQVRGYTSTDDGETWTLLGDRMLPEAIVAADYTPRAILLAEFQGEIKLLVELEKLAPSAFVPSYRGYASYDGGCSFLLVDTAPDSSAGELPTGLGRFGMTTTRRGFHVVAGSAEDGTCQAFHILTSTASQPLIYGEITEIDGLDLGSRTGGDPYDVPDSAMAIGADEAGVLYVYTQPAGTGSEAVRRSADGGHTWVACPATYIHPSLLDRPLEALQAVWHAGRMALAWSPRDSGTGATDSDWDSSIGILWMGGYSTVEQPASNSLTLTTYQRTEWRVGWMAVDLPQSPSWVQTGTPDTLEIGPDGMEVSDAAGTTVTWEWDGLISFAEETGPIVRWSWMTEDTRAAVDEEDQILLLDLVTSPGASGRYGIRVTGDATHLHIMKQTGAGTYTLLATRAVDTTEGVEVQVAISEDGKLRVWWRQVDHGPIRRWTEGLDLTQLPDISGSVADDELSWGVHLDAGQTAYWLDLVASPTGGTAISDQDPDEDLVGRPYAAVPLYITDDAWLLAVGGPTYPGETWTAYVSYSGALDQILVQDPKIGWYGPWEEGEGGDVGDERTIVLTWGDDDTFPLGDVLGIALIHQNLGEVGIDAWTEGAWEEIGTADLTVDLDDWDASGATVRGKSGTDVSLMVRMAEFDGGAFSEGKAANVAAVPIARTLQGRWDPGTARGVLQLDEAPSGSTGADGRILPRSAVILVSLRDLVASKIRLRIPGAATTSYRPPEDTWRIGRLLPGFLLLHGDETDWQRVVRVEANTEVFATRDGSRAARRWGPPRRVVEVAWSDGVDTTNAQDTTEGGFHTLDPESDAIALSGATPYQVAGLLDLVSGAYRDVVLLPRVVPFEGDARIQVLNRRHQLIHGRIASDVSLETSQGDEDVDEVIRIQRLTVEEEV